MGGAKPGMIMLVVKFTAFLAPVPTCVKVPPRQHDTLSTVLGM